MLDRISKGGGSFPSLQSLIPASHTFLKGLVLVSGVLSVLAIRQCQSIRALCWVIFSELVFVFEKVLSTGFGWKKRPNCMKETTPPFICQKIESDSGEVDADKTLPLEDAILPLEDTTLPLQQKTNLWRGVVEAVAAFGLGCLSHLFTRSPPK